MEDVSQQKTRICSNQSGNDSVSKSSPNQPSGNGAQLSICEKPWMEQDFPPSPKTSNTTSITSFSDDVSVADKKVFQYLKK